jgi:serine phosphatase RsbU (regulator of sigma subunit)
MTTLDDLRRPPPPGPDERLRVLLVEDDPGDAFLVQELLTEAAAPVDLEIAVDMASARPRIGDVHCVLLDLGLPDTTGLGGLREVLRASSGVAVCVLTGLEDEHLGIAAVGEGAQDYLVKGQVDGVLLGRALRYAVERKRADDNARRLREVELRQAESARLERGLLPKPLMRGTNPSVHTLYRPGRHRALLGGDFFDVVQTSADTLHVLIGDVCGHGVDEAPLGVALRVAWRALVLAGVPDAAVLPSLEQVLVSERRTEELFATVATAILDLAGRSVSLRLAGHPPPLVLSGPLVRPCDVRPGLVLGVVAGVDRPATVVRFDEEWALLMYTDGLIEGWAAPEGGDRLGVEGLCTMLAGRDRLATAGGDLPGWLVAEVQECNGGPLADDVAVLLIAPEPAATVAAGVAVAGPAGAGSEPAGPAR